MWFIGQLIITVVVAGAAYFYLKFKKIPRVPTLEETWWAAGPPQNEDTSIRPFEVNISDEVIQDLKRRLDNALPFQTPLEGVHQNYGINTDLLTTIVDYWKNKYDWKKRQEFLNQYPQFETNIQGLKIHFLHVKPKNVSDAVEVVPILLLHGWPGSVREFYEMIPTLIRPKKGKSFVFEVICPSLPGYGFSDGASKPGMTPARMAQIFNTLMKRLSLSPYYVQGGDWGSLIAHDLAILYPENVIAIHRNWCFTGPTHWKFFIGVYFPSLFFTEKEIERNYPLSDRFKALLGESGYFHIQATKPDTVGVALRDSPVGLAAYIIEKFITWTNAEYKNVPDGGLLTRKFTLDQLLDNVMIYWVTRSITTSVRLYSEAYTKAYRDLKLDRIPVQIPTGCNRFRNEIIYPAECILREKNTNLIHLTDFEDGGHFAAFELPDVLGNDIIDFVEKVRLNLRHGP